MAVDVGPGPQLSAAMNLIVCWKMIPDTVEELVLDAEGRALDPNVVRFKLSDADEHALEQALLLKERHGDKVSVVALEAPEVDDALWTALAKGADRAVKLTLSQLSMGTAALGSVLASWMLSSGALSGANTLVLAGSQAIDDLEGELAPYLAEALHLPYVGVVSGVAVSEDGRKVRVLKEFAGGLRGEFEVPLPAVLGIQSAERPPRYVPVARVRAVMKCARVETADAALPTPSRRWEPARLSFPDTARRVQMLEGPLDRVADQVADLLVHYGVL